METWGGANSGKTSSVARLSVWRPYIRRAKATPRTIPGRRTEKRTRAASIRLSLPYFFPDRYAGPEFLGEKLPGALGNDAITRFEAGDNPTTGNRPVGRYGGAEVLARLLLEIDPCESFPLHHT